MPLSACTSDRPLLKVTSDWAAAARVEQNEPSEQLAPDRLPGVTATGVVIAPLQKRVSPATLVIMGMDAPELWVAPSESEMRPAQPVAVLPLALAFCHSCCWSGCENRLDGLLTLPARYVARVVGWSSVPTLATTAAWPLFTSA